MNEIVLRPPSMPMPTDLAREFSLSTSDWRVLVDQLYPAAKSSESVAMALSYCRSRNLDIFKRPVHIVPMWSSALNKMVETVWPGIAEIRTTAARTGEYAGIDEVVFGPMVERTFHGEKDIWENKRKVGTEKFTKTVRYPEWASVVVYRWVKGEKAAFHAKIFWEETYASIGKSDVPNEMWAKRPRGQLDKCAEAAAIRKAFPEEVGNTYAAEEMEGRTIDGVVIDHEPTRQSPTPPSPPKPPAPPKPQAQPQNGAAPQPRQSEAGIASERSESDVIYGEIVDDNTSEVTDGASEIDDTEFFEHLEEAMSGAVDAAEIEELWTEFDPMARFDGKPNSETNHGIALSIRKRADKRIGSGK